ncbi:MAG: sulfatase [Anaerolineae bacterium]
MKAIVLLFDSLNRHFLPPYGNTWVHAPNFERLAERALTFNTSYVCSTPCMPARRDFHTARPNFLHAPWVPLETFDDSVPEILSKHGVYTHLVSDHYHYWEDNGHYYNTRYDTWEFLRGQEGDPWIGQVADPEVPETINKRGRRQDWVNRPYISGEENLPTTKTIRAGLDFVRRNQEEDNWLLHIECFDPHEPFFVPETYQELYEDPYDGPVFDWPVYDRVTDETPEQIRHLRTQYAASVSMCDARLGEVLDLMDELEMWDDTLLVVWTDHGHMLGEHRLFAKNYQPWYEELSHTPLFVWDPRYGGRGERREALVQPALDLGPTLLDYFDVEPTPDMLGHSLTDTIAKDTPVREAAIFGNFGHHVNVTDGQHVYYRAPGPENAPLCAYTLQTIRLRRQLVGEGNLPEIELVPPLSFTKGMPVLRVATPGSSRPAEWGTLLFNLAQDPGQNRPLDEPALERRMIAHLIRLMRECDAPEEQYERLGLIE